MKYALLLRGVNVGGKSKHYVASSPGRSRLAEVVCREALRGNSDAVVTVRNWNTVLALAERTV